LDDGNPEDNAASIMRQIGELIMEGQEHGSGPAAGTELPAADSGANLVEEGATVNSSLDKECDIGSRVVHE